MTYQDDVKLFMRLGGQEYADKLTVHKCPPDLSNTVYTAWKFVKRAMTWASARPTPATLSIRLLSEETAETVQAISHDNIEEIADGLVDIVYIVMGIANRYGIDFDAVWSEVHSANLSKFPEGVAVRDSAGKVIKPPNWCPPDIAGALGIK